MFGVGLQEMVIIGLLFLVVFGPDKLTGTAREFGRFVSEARRSVEEFKAELVSEEEPHREREPERSMGHLEQGGDRPQSALSKEGTEQAMSVEGADDGAAFEAYMRHFFLPTLKRGQMVMDNLQVHKSSRVRKLIESAAASVRQLPLYSPDFSPIEETFSNIKAILHSIGARTQKPLVKAIDHTIDVVS